MCSFLLGNSQLLSSLLELDVRWQMRTEDQQACDAFSSVRVFVKWLQALLDVLAVDPWQLLGSFPGRRTGAAGGVCPAGELLETPGSDADSSDSFCTQR